MTKKIQGALGKNAKTMNPTMDFSKTTYSDIGQVIVDSMNGYLETYLNVDDGSALVDCIHSKNLRDSAKFSARSARIAYLLGKATILGEDSRKGIVRTQIIEYGAVAEAILLDLVQSVGIKNVPAGVRPQLDTKGSTIDWANDGLFSTSPPGSRNLKYRFDFKWLIDQSKRLGAIDDNLKRRLTWLRTSRNLVHPVIPTAQRYRDDVHSGRAARDTVVALRDASSLFKTDKGLL